MTKKQSQITRIKVGVSSCLLGNSVRYDGEHSYDACINESMSDLFELVVFCPEVAIGLGIPRPPINLVSVNGVLRVRGVVDTSHDVTDELIDYAKQITGQLNELNGYIFKSRSPSCGTANVNVYDGDTKQVVNTSAGLFAKIIMQNFSQLPIADEIMLQDKKLRMEFINNVKNYAQIKNKKLTS